MGGRGGRADEAAEDLLFFLLQVKRKQSGKWSVRAVSRRGAPPRPASLPRASLAPSALTPSGRRAERPSRPSRCQPRRDGKRSLWLRLGRWGRGPGPGTSRGLGAPRGWPAGVSRRLEPVRPGPVRVPVSSEPGQGRPPGGPPGPGPRLRSGPGRPLYARREGRAQLPCACTACPAQRDGGAPRPVGGVRAALPAAERPRLHPPRRWGSGSVQPRVPCPEGKQAGPGGSPAAQRGSRCAPTSGAAPQGPAKARGRRARTSARRLGPARPPQPWRGRPGLERGRRGAVPGAQPCRPVPFRPAPSGLGPPALLPRVYCSGAQSSAPGSAAEPGLRRQNRLQLCISGLFFFLLFNTLARNSA